MRRYLCIFLPRWPIQCLRRTHADTIRQPCAVFERSQHGEHLVVCSTEANYKGIRTGMSLTDARALVPTLLHHEFDLIACSATLQKLCLWSTRFSPLTALESAGEHLPFPQSLMIDITGCDSVFGGEESLLHAADSALKRQKLKARLAIAPTQGAAWALAHYGPLLTSVSDDPAELSEAISSLPIACLRLSPAIVADFQPLGIHRVSHLLKIPRNAIPSRFGNEVLNRLDQAFGVRPEKFIPLRAAPEFRIARAFQYSVSNAERLCKVIEEMMNRLSDELQKAERGARHIECWLHHEIAEPKIAEVALHRCSAGKKHLWQLLRTRLEDHFRERPVSKKRKKNVSVGSIEKVIEVDESVDAVALHVTVSEPLHDKQMPLLDHRPLDDNEDFNLLIDRLVTKLGPASVFNVELVNDPLPERSFRLVPVHEAKRVKPAGRTFKVPRRRPMTLLPKPQPIQFSEKQFTLNNELREIRMLHSLERVESGWWRECDQRRDYYVVECSDGSQHWIFRDLIKDEWFLHGSFD